jgi:hypothetical protein
VGKASQQKKVARAATTGGGRTVGKKRPMGWYSIMAALVALGLFLVGFSRNQELSKGQAATKTAPRLNKDHWHSSLSIYICDHFLPNIAQFESVDGIHTHGDGVIHVHPFVSSAGGKNAVLGVFAHTEGMKLNAGELKEAGGHDYRSGDRCPNGKVGEVQVRVFRSQADPLGQLATVDPAKIPLRNGQLLTIAFMPRGAHLPPPPSASQLTRLNDVTPTTTIPTTAPPATTAATTTATTTTTPATPATTTATTTPATTTATTVKK